MPGLGAGLRQGGAEGLGGLESLRRVGRQAAHDDGVEYQSEPWKSAYPELAAMPDDWAALSAPDALWLSPVGNVFERNVSFRNGKFIANAKAEGGGVQDRWLVVRDNLQNQDPQFVDEAALNLALKPSSPAFALDGFQPIPFNGIGPH